MHLECIVLLREARLKRLHCLCSVPKLCQTLYDPMDCSRTGFPVLAYLLGSCKKLQKVTHCMILPIWHSGKAEFWIKDGMEGLTLEGQLKGGILGWWSFLYLCWPFKSSFTSKKWVTPEEQRTANSGQASYSKRISTSNKGEEHYFTKTKKLGRVVLNESLLEKSESLRGLWSFIGWVVGIVISWKRYSVHLFLLRSVFDGSFLLVIILLWSVIDSSSCNWPRVVLCENFPFWFQLHFSESSLY